jgi:predicted flap endonuclease-1-like 5' DNA nuclease
MNYIPIYENVIGYAVSPLKRSYKKIIWYTTRLLGQGIPSGSSLVGVLEDEEALLHDWFSHNIYDEKDEVGRIVFALHRLLMDDKEYMSTPEVVYPEGNSIIVFAYTRDEAVKELTERKWMINPEGWPSRALFADEVEHLLDGKPKEFVGILEPYNPDDLTRISGVNKLFAKKLNDNGVYLFQQIVDLSEADLIRLDKAMQARGRISKSDFVERAKLLIEEDKNAD